MYLIGFTFAYNVEYLIPYVIPYIERGGYDKFIVYDNMSTDKTVELLSKYPIEIRSWNTQGQFDDIAKRNLILHSVREAQSYTKKEDGSEQTVWCTITDFDEVIYNYEHDWKKIYLRDMLYWGADNELTSFNVFDGCMIDLFTPSKVPPILKPGQLVHSSPEIRGCFWNFWGNKPLIFKVNDIEIYSPHEGNHVAYVQMKEGKTISRMQNLNIPIIGFHLKFLDIENLKKIQKEYSERGLDHYQDFNNNIDFFFENTLMPTSFKLNDYFLQQTIAHNDNIALGMQAKQF